MEWALTNVAIQTSINPYLKHQRHTNGLRHLSIEESHHHDRGWVPFNEKEPTVAKFHVSCPNELLNVIPQNMQDERLVVKSRGTWNFIA